MLKSPSYDLVFFSDKLWFSICSASTHELDAAYGTSLSVTENKLYRDHRGHSECDQGDAETEVCSYFVSTFN